MSDRAEVLELLTRRTAAVLLRDPGTLGPDDRLDQDLGLDSLDLLEIVEGVEQDLRSRGVRVTIPDEALVTLETLGDVADRFAAEARQGA